MPGKQLNPQHPAPQQQYKSHLKPHQHKPDEEEDGRVSYRIDQGEWLIKASREELSFPIKQELKAVTTATTSTKYYQVFTQAFTKPATV